MDINTKQLKKISHSFHSVCNRLMHSDFDDYEINLKKFVEYIHNNELINEFIKNQGMPDLNAEEVVKDVMLSHGRKVFDIGPSDPEEIRDINAIITFIADNQIQIQRGYAQGYSHSNRYQDWAKSFNERFVMILIRHIDEYLMSIGIDMGVDENAVYNISFSNGQMIISENGVVIATTNNLNQIDEQKIAELIGNIQKECSTITVAELANINDHLKTIKEETCKPVPNKTSIEKALTALSEVKSTTEFGAAVVTLIQFIQSMGL